MSLKYTISQRLREFYWEHAGLQRLYSASALSCARWTSVTSDPYTALVHYCNAARRVRPAGLRAARLKEFATFVKSQFNACSPETLDKNIFVRSFLESAEADKIRARWSKYSRRQRLNLGGNLILLKAPREGEHGVLLIFYTGAFAQFLVNFRLDEVCSRYRVVLEPSWFTFPEPYWALGCSEENPLICQVFDQDAVRAVQECRLPLIALPMGAQDWVDPDVFKPLPGVKKEFDAIMIANFARYKRHDVMFRAMQRMRPRRIRLAIVGVTWERTRAEFEAEVRHFGMERDVVIFQGLSPPQVNEVFNKAKVNIFLARMEGGNRGVMEGFAANVPCIVYKHIYGGVRRSDINCATGVFADDEELHEVLLATTSTYDKFQPRAWFLQNTGYQNSTAKLNAFLREEGIRRREKWTADIVPKANRPEPVYISERDKASLEGGWDELERSLTKL